MKKFLTAVAASLLFVASSAFAVPTAQQIEQAMSQGNWQKADAGLSEVLQAHPNNAHAHYLYAQVLDREGRYDDALSHLRQAKSLDPQLKFTDPMRFAATEARIRGDANRANVVANVPGAGQQANQTGSVAQKPSFNPAPAQEKHGPSIGSWVGIAVLFAAIAARN
jgi:tetratricopeptide (TPR) repeat protein